jgi:hypothetical protein
MAKDKISDYSSTANSNTDIAGINIDEGCAPSGINDAIRTLMAQLKTWQSGGQDVYIHPAGSASAPSITANGDTNTGIFFPAADTVGITTGGTERARVDSAGNLGLGVTPSAWGTSAAVFRSIELGAAGNAIAGLTSPAGSEIEILTNAYYNSGWKYAATGRPALRASLNGDVSGAFTWNIAGSGTAGNAISFTQAMTLDASGNFMVGGTSANGRARFVAAASTDCVMNLETSTNNYASGLTLNALNSNGAIYNFINSKYGSTEMWYVGGNGADSTLVFKTGGTERARIDSSGNLLVGTTSTSVTNGGNVYITGTGGYAAMGHANGTGSGTYYYQFLYNGSGIGGITQNGTTAVAYNTSSDYRLKNSVAPMTGALAKVAALNPVTYKWNSDGSDGEGFIAHELAEVCPHAVTGEKDAVDADGNPVYQGIDTSFLVATLTAAIKEQQAIIQQLQADVAALKGQA